MPFVENGPARPASAGRFPPVAVALPPHRPGHYKNGEEPENQAPPCIQSYHLPPAGGGYRRMRGGIRFRSGGYLPKRREKKPRFSYGSRVTDTAV